ncbi:MAG: oligosaccharide flippase family protein [Cellvibrionaceae bacterium]
MSDYKILFKGSVVRFVTLVCSIAIAFFMMPFIIHTVGDRWYGLWVVIASLLSFYGMMDLGLSSATQRYLSYSLPKDDNDKINEYFNSSLFVYIGISVIVLVITTLLVLFAEYFVDDPQDLTTFQMIFAIMGGTLAISFPFFVVNGILVANLRYDISANLNLLKIIIRSILVYIALENGYSIIAMAIITSVTDLAANFVLTYYAKKLAPWAKLGKRYVKRSTIKKLFSYSGYALLGTTAIKARTSSAPLIISNILNLSIVTIYSIAAQFVEYFLQAISAILSVSFPLLTKNASLNDHEKQRSDFILITKLSAIVSTLGMTIIVLLCKPFITVWMGPEYSESADIAILLIAGTAFVSCQQTAHQAFFATNKHNLNAFMATAEAISTITLGIFLTREHGLIGMAVALIAPQVIIRLFVQPPLICKIIDISLWQYLWVIFKQILITLLVIAGYYYISPKFSINGYFEILIAACMIGLTHSAISLISHFSIKEIRLALQAINLNKLSTRKTTNA